jgi:hypothetical protein
MKKLLGAFAVAAAAAAVGGLTGAPAKAASNCAGELFNAGYSHAGIPGVGGAFSASLGNFGSVVTGSSSSENWEAANLEATGSNGAWVEAGVIDDIAHTFLGVTYSGLPTSGWVQYIAYQVPPAAPVLHLYGAANNNAYYAASITHAGNANWTAKIGSNTITNIPVSFSGATTDSEFLADSSNSDSNPICNGMAFKYKSLSPWFITNPLQPIQSGPYRVTPGSDNDSFTAFGS